MDALTAGKVKAAKVSDSAYKLYDGGGLFLLVQPNGKKLWRFRYSFGKREKLLSFGTFPEISLKRAREKRREARDQLDRGLNPSDERKKQLEADQAAQSNAAGIDALEYVAYEYLAIQAGGRQLLRAKNDRPPSLAELRTRFDQQLEKMAKAGRRDAGKGQTLSKMHRRLERFVFPYLGKRAVRTITTQELQRVIVRIDERGTHETARRTLAACRRIWRYAMATFRAEADPSTFDAKDVLTPVSVKHFPAITDPKRVGELLRGIHGYEGDAVTVTALKLLPLVFVRPGELRGAEWSEIDLKGSEWRIAAERMKMGDEHIVPLAKQAVALLEELKPLTSNGPLVFPSLRSRSRSMSENTLGAALRRLGFTKDEMVAHGFRSTASTLLHELGWDPLVIELQLAHQERNAVKRAYNRSHRLEERRKMMQAWADYLDALRTGAKVTAMRRARHARRA